MHVLWWSEREIRETGLRDALLEVVSDVEAVQQLQTGETFCFWSSIFFASILNFP